MFSVNDLTSFFNNPFIKTIYTGNPDEYRSRGQMSLKFSPKIKDYKYFKCLDLNFNVMIDKIYQRERTEIVNLSFNRDRNNKLEQYAIQYTNVKDLINYINSLNYSKKYELFNLINLDTSDSFSTIISNIEFSYYNKNQIKATITLKDKYRMVNSNFELTNQIEIISQELKVKTYSEKVILSLNEDLIIERAKFANNYNEFKEQNGDLSKALDLVNLTFSQENDKTKLVQSIQFLDTPDFFNKVTIKVILNDGYYFNNNTNEQIISLSNVN